MEQVYLNTGKVLKALSDPKRLKIVDMLSCGELCASRILESFRISQPTLSHDMKVLLEAGIVRERREGKNTFYSLDRERLDEVEGTLHRIWNTKEDCICRGAGGCPEKCSCGCK